MNKFIVWDVDMERFQTEDELMVNENGLVCNSQGELLEENIYKPKWHIGKTDIEDNDIYADCSIVEMTINDEDGMHSHKGFFNYNEALLCYEFKEPIPGAYGRRIWRMERLQTYSVIFKIIGTLQENGELLND